MDDDEFYDTISMETEEMTPKDSHNNLIGSLNTLYHSAIDLDVKELLPLNRINSSELNHFKKRWRSFTSKNVDVDFVLAYEDQGTSEDVKKRKTFEENLQSVGLLLEKEKNQWIHFVKIHVPKELLCQYAEILKLRLPIIDDEVENLSQNIIASTFSKIMHYLGVSLDPQKFPQKPYQLTAEFRRDKNYLFDIDSPDFFNSSTRTIVASYILERERFGNEDQDKGIKRLITEGVYKAAYPLHDGLLHKQGSKRNLLFKEWASVKKCFKFQPIDEIKDYFGVQFALYFAWLGFYTYMLLPASFVGILCVIYALATLETDDISQDICNSDIIMCPRCDKHCDYWKLSDGCTYAKIQHFIDNPSTIFFAVFMSFWATLYLELWKRYSAEITHKWGLTGFDLQAEPPRPEYLIKLSHAKKKKLNVVTQLQEPVVPFWRMKLPSIILSFGVALLWVFLAVSVVFAVMLYRMSIFASAVVTNKQSYYDVQTYLVYVVPVTTGLINLVCILVMNVIYDRLAKWLTDIELQRTQTEYDDSLALKIYMFQFVNYYSSIFYIAFFKGKFVGYPGKYNKIFGFRQEECNLGGCLMELTVQLTIIMIGKQALYTIMEMSLPLLMKMYTIIKMKTGIEDDISEDTVIIHNQWTEDYKLSSLESQSLFSEYLEMVLQYGFVTIFVTAFPLAPLFALINNVLEMRLDATKFIKYFRRPVPQRVSNIGVWYPIMAFIGHVSVISNAFIIAFSSHFIPRLVYIFEISADHTDKGYLEHSLAYFNTSDFVIGNEPQNTNFGNVTICRYAEYRNPPDHELKYKTPLIYWHILAARLAFIVVYQNLVSFVMKTVEWTIPDVSRKLNDKIKREAYRTNETIIKHEAERDKHKINQIHNPEASNDVIQ